MINLSESHPCTRCKKQTSRIEMMIPGNMQYLAELYHIDHISLCIECLAYWGLMTITMAVGPHIITKAYFNNELIKYASGQDIMTESTGSTSTK